jgi:hypothetical protein
MTATKPIADDAEELTEQQLLDVASILAARTIAVAGELHSDAHDVELMIDDSDTDALQEIIGSLDEAADEIVALNELAQQVDLDD